MNKENFPDFCLCGLGIKNLNRFDSFATGIWICENVEDCWWIWVPENQVVMEVGKPEKKFLLENGKESSN